MSDVAREAGLSRQSVYDHFGSRAELMVETARYGDEVRGIDERLREYRAAVSGVDRLDTYVEFWGEYVAEILGIARALREMKDTDDAARAAWDNRMEAVHEVCRGIVSRLRDDGTLADGWTEEDAADAMWATLSIANWESLILERGWSVDRYVENVKKQCHKTFVGEGRISP